MEFTLVPPTVDQVQAGTDRFLSRYLLPQGITLILRGDGSVYERTYPSQDELNAAQGYWLGGHQHTISQATRDLLVAAGYGAYITEE